MLVAIKNDFCGSISEPIKGLIKDWNDIKWRTEREHEHKNSLAFAGYQRKSYIIASKAPRFGSGEGKGVLLESVRGTDLYIMVDVCNYSESYSLNGMKNHMSPDDHYQDLKSIIASASGKAKRINVIMPFLPFVPCPFQSSP